MGETRAELSAEVAKAAWIADRLSPVGCGVVTSVVPGGFETYARVLHPVQEQGRGCDRLIRWAKVAAWSGVELVPGCQFSDIAFPAHEPHSVAPWSGQRARPQEGTLYRPDTDVLVEVLGGHTARSDRCWFCMWEGWGPSIPGPRVQLPGRNHLLFRGPLTTVPSLVESQEGRTPNLWWPDDHAWCVASEIDLPWTYVGGSTALIGELLADTRVEVQPASPGENFHQRVPDWLAPALAQATADLIASGQATLRTWRGAVHAQLELPQQAAAGSLRTQLESSDSTNRGSGWQRIGERDPDRLREIMTGALTWRVLELL